MRLSLLFASSLLCTASLSASLSAQESTFSSNVIDIGVVVRDIDVSVKFYTEALGMQEIAGFSVPGAFAGQVGLTANQPLQVRVLTLGKGDHVTKLKLMQLPGAKAEKSKNEFIHSTLGFSYLTLAVTDTTAAVARLKKAGVKTLKKSPLPLPAPLPTHIFLTMVRDPDGNFVELVGPRR